MPTQPAFTCHLRWLLCLLALLAGCWGLPTRPAQAQTNTHTHAQASIQPLPTTQDQASTRIKSARLETISNDPSQSWGLNADLELNLGPKLKDALNRGLPLQFAWDVLVLRKRWYWADQEVAKTTLNSQLAYNALTRTYRVQTPHAAYTTASLDEALAYITRPRDWPVLRRDQLPNPKAQSKTKSKDHSAQVRFRLVLAELPKPFQISALVNSDWDLYTNWQALDWGAP